MTAIAELSIRYAKVTDQIVLPTGEAGSLWDGSGLVGTISLDTETSKISDDSPWEVPPLALAAASDGETHVFITPPLIPEFIRAHQEQHLVAHNAEFDARVIARFLTGADRERWLEIIGNGQLHCTRRLAQLIDIAEKDFIRTGGRPYALDSLCQQYSNDVEVNKEDPYRLRYGELVGHDWRLPVEAGYLTYALNDPIVTLKLWHVLRQRAWEIMQRNHLPPDLVLRYGYLTESLQVRAAIALNSIFENGIHVDEDRVTEGQAALELELLESAADLEELTAAGTSIFKRHTKTGQFRRTAGGALQMMQKPQRDILAAIAEREAIQAEYTEKTGDLSLSSRFWKNYPDADPFVEAWLRHMSAGKLIAFFRKLKGNHIHPRYAALVRTGRTSCSDPNLQQVPRPSKDGSGPNFRKMFVSPSGKVLVKIDYAAIEMVTLARVQEVLYGSSHLGNILRQGIDPHCYTGAKLLGMTYEDFVAIRKDPQHSRHVEVKDARQNSKIVNFGLGGGLGDSGLVRYAKSGFGKTLTLDQAAEFRRITYEAFPELERYLAHDDREALAANLQCDLGAVQEAFVEAWQIGQLRRIVNGDTFSRYSGEEYAEDQVDEFYAVLTRLNDNPEWSEAIAERDTSNLYRLFWQPTTTITGRVRGRVKYTVGRNSPFQGLAADGAKLALWELYRAGYRIVAFVHDEVVIELDKAAVTDAVSKIEKLMVQPMQALVGTIPVRAEPLMGPSWGECREVSRSAPDESPPTVQASTITTIEEASSDTRAESIDINSHLVSDRPPSAIEQFTYKQQKESEVLETVRNNGLPERSKILVLFMNVQIW